MGLGDSISYAFPSVAHNSCFLSLCQFQRLTLSWQTSDIPVLSNIMALPLKLQFRWQPYLGSLQGLWPCLMVVNLRFPLWSVQILGPHYNWDCIFPNDIMDSSRSPILLCSTNLLLLLITLLILRYPLQLRISHPITNSFCWSLIAMPVALHDFFISESVMIAKW